MGSHNRNGTIELVLEYFTRLRSARQAACAAELGLARKAVYKSVESLVKKGLLIREPGVPGLYRCAQASPGKVLKVAEKQVKIWRAMKLKRTFTRWDLAFYSGASLDYVKRYLMFLQNAGYVSKLGHEGDRILYAIEGSAPKDAPQMTSGTFLDTRTDRLLEDALELVGAIRAGERARAREAHARIGAALAGKEKRA